MKRVLYIAALTLIVACTEKIAPDVIVVPTPAIEIAFDKTFPNVNNVEWSKGQNEYYIVIFNHYASLTIPGSTQLSKAWYTPEGENNLMETEYNDINELPYKVRIGAEDWLTNRFTTTKQEFVIDDIERTKREGNKGTDIYTLGVKSTNTAPAVIKLNIYFNPEGEPIAAKSDAEESSDGEDMPTPMKIQSYINNNYANVVILGAEIENQGVDLDGDNISDSFYKIDIVANQLEVALIGVEFELLFSNNDKMEFQQEVAELRLTQAPKILQYALRAIAPNASNLNIEIDRIVIADSEATYKIEAEGDASILDGRVFNAKGKEMK